MKLVCAAAVEEPARFESRADGARFAAILVDDHVGPRVLSLESRLDEIHLRLHRRQVVLRPALEQEPRPDGRQVRNLRNVEPDILRQHVAQARHDLFGLPALALEIDDVRLHEHRAAVAERREALRAEGHVGELLHRIAEPLRCRLQEVAVAGRALRVQLEILHAAVLEDDDLDVLPAHVADHVDVFVEVQAGLGVRHGLDDRRVRAHHVLQDVFRVAGGAHAEHLQRGALLGHLALELAQDLDGVLYGIALREPVRLQQDAAALVLRNQHGLGRGGAAVEADKAFHHLARLELRVRVLVVAVARPEILQLFGAGSEASARALRGLLFAASVLDVPLQALPALVTTDAIVFAFAEFDGADGREILRVVGRADQVFGRNAFGQREVALLPDFRDVALPALLHPHDVAVRTAEQQHHRPQRVAAREHREILHHDGLEQRRHQLIGRDAGLLQPIDIGLREHAALACHRMQAHTVVAHLAELIRGDAQLGVDLVDHRAGAARALVVHRGELLLAPGLGVFLEDDDLGVLPAQLDHRAALGIELLHRERDRVDLLDELRAQVSAQAVASGAGHKDAALLGLEAVDLGLESFQKLEHLLGLLGVVPLVVAPDDLVGDDIRNDGLDRGRTHVEPNHVVSRQHSVKAPRVKQRRLQPGFRSSCGRRCAARSWPRCR